MRLPRFRLCLLLFAALVSSHLYGAEPPSPTAENDLKRLKDTDPEVRIEALRNLQTSVDPRVPEAVLPLLADEGNSIRRLAARAVGSRWWQISQERSPVFLKALKRNASSEFEDERNMGRRAQGLLTRTYEGDMFARSADKRWVVYERYGLPCLIDTKTGTEELLGWAPGGAESLTSAWGNTPTAPDIFWHESKPMAAFSILLGRKESTVWIWRHGVPLRKLETTDLFRTLGLKDENISLGGGVFVEVKGWKKEELLLELTFGTSKGEKFTDHTVTLGWNAASDALRVIDWKKQEG